MNLDVSRATSIKSEDESSRSLYIGIAKKWKSQSYQGDNILNQAICPIEGYINNLSLDSIYEDNQSLEHPFECHFNSTGCLTKPTNINMSAILAIGFLSGIDRIMQEKHRAAPQFFGVLDPSIYILKAGIENAINSYELLPVSYNQVMIRGTLRYCARILDKIDDFSDSIVDKIKRYVFLVESLRRQVESSTTFAQLDLTYIENKFEFIEEEASDRGYLPKLENLTL